MFDNLQANLKNEWQTFVKIGERKKLRLPYSMIQTVLQYAADLDALVNGVLGLCLLCSLFQLIQTGS